MEMFISLMFATSALIVANAKMDNIVDIVFKNIFIVLLLTAAFIGSYLTGAEAGQKQALRGKFDYKMEIKYELKDSVYTPVDTTFTEIKH